MSLPEAPQSRGEQYLSKIAGVDKGIPEVPQSRVEQYLEYIANNGVGPSEEEIAEAVSEWMEDNIHEDPTVVIDKSLAVEGAAADSKSVGDEISDLKANLDDLISGEEEREITGWVHEKYINVANVNIGDTIDITNVSSFYSLKYVIVDCEEGDKFLLNLVGAASARAWAFLTSSNVLISRADASVTLTDVTITAPQNAGKVIFQCIYRQTPDDTTTDEGIAYKIVAGTGNVVRFDITQNKTEAEKARARANIGVSDWFGDVTAADNGKIMVVADGEPTLGNSSFKYALLSLLNKVVFTVPDAQNYILAVANSLSGSSSSMLTVSTKPNYHVYVTDTLDAVKNQLVVAYNGETITDYNLTGSLAIGTTSLIVGYNGESASVTITVENFSFDIVVGGVSTNNGLAYVASNNQRATNNPIAFLLKPGTYKLKWPSAINGYYFNINAINYDEETYPNKDFSIGSADKQFFTSSQCQMIWFGGNWQNADQTFTVLDNYTRCIINIKKGSAGTSIISSSDVALIEQYASLEIQ